MYIYRKTDDLPTVPVRIVSLVPSITETIFDLGAGDRLVGRTKFCVEPKGKVEKVERVGGTKDFHVDWIAGLQPDLILANKEENDEKRVISLMGSFPTVVYEIATLDNALDMIVNLGQLLKAPTQASKIRMQILEQFANLEELPRRTAAYLIWDSPMMVAGGDTFINAMLEKAGFLNVFGEWDRYPTITEPELRDASPEVVLLSSEPFPFKGKHAYKYSTLLPEAKISLVDGTYFSWYGSRLKDAPDYFRSMGKMAST